MRIFDIASAPEQGLAFTATIVGMQASHWTDNRLHAPVVRFEDCSGRAGLLIPQPLESRLSELVNRVVIQGIGDFVSYEWGLGGWLRQWKVAEPEVLSNALAAQPISACPEDSRPALLDLANAIDKLQTAAIRAVVNDVLSGVMPELLTASASYSHHHSGVGGLLRHTAEVALMAWAEAHICFPSEPWRAETVFLAALMHDLAKAHVQGATPPNPLMKSAHHEIGSMLLAAPCLLQLGEAHPSAGALMGTILRWLLHGRAYIAKFPCPEGEIIRAADHASVRRDRCLRPALIPANDGDFSRVRRSV